MYYRFRVEHGMTLVENRFRIKFGMTLVENGFRVRHGMTVDGKWIPNQARNDSGGQCHPELVSGSNE